MIISLLAGACLSFSYIVEIWGGFEPCRLCLIQRYIYAGLVLVGVTGYILKAKKVVCTIILLVLSAGFLVASYHSLAYFGFVETRCASQISDMIDESSFIQSLSAPAPCSQKIFNFLGIPAPSVNALLYLLGFWVVYKRCSSTRKTSTNSD